MSTPPVNLTDDEIDDICRPRTQGSAQIKYLRSLGLRVERRIDGTPLVNRAHYNAVMTEARPAADEAVAAGEQPVWGVH